jgi:uncharacterized repeat protein (TIGR01451 family)
MRVGRGCPRHRSFAAAAAFLVLTTLLAGGITKADAAPVQPFAISFHTDVNGAIVQTGNTLESCNSFDFGCSSARSGSGPSVNNNNWDMTYVDADPIATTTLGFFSSSSANLSLPARATVLYAQLSWGARTQAGSSGSNSSGRVDQMRFRTPGSSGYQTITAASVYGNNPFVSSGEYEAFADVTSIVRSAGAGTYWGANVAAATGFDRYAGWSLVVALSDPAQPLRDLTVFNGFSILNTTQPQTINLSGFLAPQFGTVTASVGVVAYDGDLGATGDQMKLNNVALSDAVVPSNNFFDSGISALGVLITARSPAYSNTLGLDVKTVAAPGVIPNGATSSTVTLTTGNDGYAPGVITTAIDLFSPQFPASTKTVTDLTPTTPPLANVGDTLEYTIDLPNTGGDGAANAVITDALPPNVTYVPGSIQYATGTVGGTLGPFTTLSDSAGDDNGEFVSGTPPGGTGTVQVRAGVGANATTGGTIRPNDRVVVKFRVTVNTAAATSTISNVDQLNYTLSTLGTAVSRTGLPASIGVAAAADLAISKTATPSPLAPGQNATYTLTVVNNGPNTATNVVATDTLPASMTFVSATPSVGGPCTFAAPRVSCPLGSVSSRQTATITVVAALPANASGVTTVNDIASVSAATSDPVAANNTASITTPVRPTADVAAGIAITAGSPATPGNPVALTLTGTNNGPSDSSAVKLTSDLSPLANVAFSGTPPSGCAITGTVVTCAAASLAAGSSLAVNLTATVPPSQIGASVGLTDQVSASTFDPIATNNAATTTLALSPPSADVAITKTALSATAVAGGDFSYTLTIRNNGPSDAASVTLSDAVPAQFVVGDVTPSRGTCQPPSTTVACAFGTFPPGAIATVNVTGSIPTDAPVGAFTNNATGASSTPDPNAANNSASVTTTVVANVDVAITKTATPKQAVPGSPMTFTLTATNNGPSLARSVSIVDTLPDPLVLDSVTNANGNCTAPALGSVGGVITCGVGDIPADGTTRVVTITATVPSSFTTPVTNTATISADGTDLNPANNDASYDVNSSPVADVSITKAVTAPIGRLVAGAPVTWQLTATNDGPSDAAAVQVSDPVPAGFVSGVTATFGPSATPCAVAGTAVTCAVGTLASGQSVGVTVTGTVLATAPSGSQLVNTASVSTSTADPTLSNNVDSTVSPISTSADLAITRSPTSATVDAGGVLTYTFTVTNNGPSDAQTPQFVDVIPLGMDIVPGSLVTPPGWSCVRQGQTVTCTAAGDMAPNTSVTGSAELQFDPSLPAGTQLSGTATVSSPTADPVASNDSASGTATITVSADLHVTKSVSPSPLVAGTDATYTIAVTNNGPSDASGVTMTDPLPFTGSSDSDISPTQGTCTLASDTATCDLGGLVPGETATVAIVVHIPPDATGSATNTATATALTPDPNSADNTATTTDAITSEADVQIIKTASASSIAAGGVVDYTLTVTNGGPSSAANVGVTDVIPSGFTVVIANTSPACTLVASTLTCPVGSLEPGGTMSFVVELNAAASLAPGDYANTATVTATTSDPDATNNTSTATVTVSRIADLSTVKSADTNLPAAGTTFTYIVSASNAGPSDAASVVVTDTLPAALTFVSSPDGCTAAGQTVTCTVATLAAGSRADFRVIVALSPSTPPGPLTNTATTTGAVSDPDPTNNIGSSTVTVQLSADLSITKTITSGPVVAGRLVTYAISIANQGPSDGAGVGVVESLPNATFVSSDAPGGPCAVAPDGTAACPVGAVPVGSVTSFNVVFMVNANATGTLTNTAQLVSASLDPSDADNTAIVSSPIGTSADVIVTKTAGAPQFTAGGPVSWTMTVHDSGPSDAQSVLIDDPIDPAVSNVTITSTPAGVCTSFPCTVATLAADGTVTIAIDGTLAPSFTGISISADGSASSPTADSDLTNNAVTTTTPVVTAADVAVAKTGPASVERGAPISWRVTVTNHGPSDAQTVAATDTVPAIVGQVTASSSQTTCTVTGNAVSCGSQPLAAGATISITVAGTVVADAPLGPLTNHASASTATSDPTPANDTAAATTQVAAPTGSQDEPTSTTTTTTTAIASGPGAVKPGSNAASSANASSGFLPFTGNDGIAAFVTALLVVLLGALLLLITGQPTRLAAARGKNGSRRRRSRRRCRR